MILYYDHETTTITDDHSAIVSFKRAQFLVNDDRLSDWNCAFGRLMNAGFNTDQVAAEYAELAQIEQDQES